MLVMQEDFFMEFFLLDDLLFVEGGLFKKGGRGGRDGFVGGLS